MKTATFFPALLIVAGSLLSGCALGTGSLASDVNSSNPAVAAQAQKVQDLERQVSAQEAVSDAEKNKLDALKQQLEGAKENLKGVKTLAKSN